MATTLLITDPMAIHRSLNEWSRKRLESAAITIAELLDVNSYYVTTSPTEFRERTGYGTGRSLGYTNYATNTIYVGLRHKKRSKYWRREPQGPLSVLVHEFCHLRWPKFPHSPKFSEYVCRVYNGEHIPRRKKTVEALIADQ